MCCDVSSLVCLGNQRWALHLISSAFGLQAHHPELHGGQCSANNTLTNQSLDLSKIVHHGHAAWTVYNNGWWQHSCQSVQHSWEATLGAADFSEVDGEMQGEVVLSVWEGVSPPASGGVRTTTHSSPPFERARAASGDLGALADN
jgi:hypothetical protein